ncbi:MAG: hypothetical protein QNJ92_00835 [Alphaproteobacteria bacterium]|nr:hypothetical protein [Alphaproteobacteria bacterium]
MSFRILFWNIENYAGDPVRTETVVGHVKKNTPDVIGFSEIKDKAALRGILHSSLVDYDFGITDGAQGIELLAGWRRGAFEQALFTQRREFKADSPFLRPGSLLSVKRGGVFFNILFLHTDSGRKSKDYTNRQEMFEKVWSLKEKLDDITPDASQARLLVLGDLNTMGRQAGAGLPAISGEQEVANLKADAESNQMKLPPKSHANTWARVDDTGKIELQSNLDHLLATENVTLLDAGDGHEVLVRGWVDASGDDARRFFVEEISDHSSIECVVEA